MADCTHCGNTGWEDFESLENASECPYCANDSEKEAEEEDSTCATCNGTGIGQYGDPNTSRCHSCGGKGFIAGDSDDFDMPDKYDDVPMCFRR